MDQGNFMSSKKTLLELIQGSAMGRATQGFQIWGFST